MNPVPCAEASLAPVPFLFPQYLPCFLLLSSTLLNATTTFSFILYCTPSKCPFPWQESISFMLTEAQWQPEPHGHTTNRQTMLKGEEGFSSSKRRVTGQGERPFTCKCKRTGDRHHKDQGDEGCLLKDHRTCEQHGRQPLQQIPSNRSLGTSSTLPPTTTGCACAGARVIA